jgi:hypothetical protein
VATLSGSGGGGGIALSSGSGGGGETSVPPAQVTVDLAAGYRAAATPVGSTAGLASFSSASGSASGISIVLVSGSLTVDDPAHYANDPAAQACAPGPYTAVWRLSTTILGLAYDLPVFVEHAAGDAQRIELRFCPPPLLDANGKPVTAAPVPLTDVDFLLTSVLGPTARGRYTSNAYVTPEGLGGTPDPAATVEARALDPVPHTLTLKGRYDAKIHDAVLTGRVTEAGKPQAGASVEYLRLDLFGPPRHVRTSANGAFTARVRIGSTTTFAADVPDTTGPCPGSSTAPRGCASLTVSGTRARTVRVVVPR